MGILRRAAPVALVLAFVSVVTAVLWPAMLYGIAATLCAAFFLYDPLYSFYVSSPLDVGELVWFVGLALIGAKCAADLLQPPLALPRQNSAPKD
jgi:H+/Cl- antiporter ClcA